MVKVKQGDKVQLFDNTISGADSKANYTDTRVLTVDSPDGLMISVQAKDRDGMYHDIKGVCYSYPAYGSRYSWLPIGHALTYTDPKLDQYNVSVPVLTPVEFAGLANQKLDQVMELLNRQQPQAQPYQDARAKEVTIADIVNANKDVPNPGNSLRVAIGMTEERQKYLSKKLTEIIVHTESLAGIFASIEAAAENPAELVYLAYVTGRMMAENETSFPATLSSIAELLKGRMAARS